MDKNARPRRVTRIVGTPPRGAANRPAGIFLFAAMMVGGTAGGQEPLRVGVAEVDITPPVGYRVAGGYEERISNELHDPLLAKAIVLQQGSTRAALVLCDLCSIGRQVSDPVRHRASIRSGIPVEQIVIAATHTHGGPEYYGTLRDVGHELAVEKHGHDPAETVDYPARLVARIADAVHCAADSVRGARCEAGVRAAPGLAFNRRFHMKNGTVQFNPGKLNPDIVAPAGPVDDALPILLFRDVATEKPFAALAVFAMHVATFGNGRQIGADFPGVMQQKLREALGPEFVSLFAAGAAGDVNHVDVRSAARQDPATELQRIGHQLAARVLAPTPPLEPVEKPRLAVRAARVPLPLRELGAGEVEAARAHLRRVLSGERFEFLATVAAWRAMNTATLRERDGDQLRAEVQGVRISDDTAIVTLPHEVFVELGLAIKARSPFRNTLVVSLANDIDFYVPTRKAFDEGSYEVVTSSLQPGGGERLVDGALQLLEELRRAP